MHIFQLLERPECIIVLLVAYIAALPWAIHCAREAAMSDLGVYAEWMYDQILIPMFLWLWHVITVVVRGYLRIESYLLQLLLSPVFALFYVIRKLIIGYVIHWCKQLITTVTNNVKRKAPPDRKLLECV